MQKKICIVVFFLAPLVTAFSQQTKAGGGVEAPTVNKKLIFADFYNESKDQNTRWIESSIGEAMHELAKDKYKYERIPAETWKEYVKKNNYTEADLYNEDKLQKMGIALKADGIIYGKFTSANDAIAINGKILSVVDKEVIAEKGIETPITTEMFNNVKEVSETLAARIKDLFYPSDRGAVWRSSVLPGWGQHYKQRKTFSYVYGGLIGAGFAFSAVSFILWQSANSDYKNYTPEHVITPSGETGLKDPTSAKATFAELEAKSKQWEEITLMTLGITGIIYAWHLFDAWFFDGEYASGGSGKTAFSPRGNEIYYGSVKIYSDREPLSLKFSLSF